MMARTMGGTVLPPGEKTIYLPHGVVTFRIGAGETGGAYSVIEYLVPPGAPASRPHRHNRHDETFYILEGQLSIRLDDRMFSPAAGSFLVVPRGTVHPFVNPHPEPARMLVITSPAGLEKYLEEVAELLKTSPTGALDERLAKIANSYGTEFVD